MKVRIVSDVLTQEIFEGTHVLVTKGGIYTAHENHKNWHDEDGRMYAYEVVLQDEGRKSLGWWVHDDEVEVLTPGQELAEALGTSKHFDDDLAQEILLYAVENDISVRAAVTIVLAKDIRTTGPNPKPAKLPTKPPKPTTPPGKKAK